MQKKKELNSGKSLDDIIAIFTEFHNKTKSNPGAKIDWTLTDVGTKFTQSQITKFLYATKKRVNYSFLLNNFYEHHDHNEEIAKFIVKKSAFLLTQNFPEQGKVKKIFQLAQEAGFICDKKSQLKFPQKKHLKTQTSDLITTSRKFTFKRKIKMSNRYRNPNFPW